MDSKIEKINLQSLTKSEFMMILNCVFPIHNCWLLIGKTFSMSLQIDSLCTCPIQQRILLYPNVPSRTSQNTTCIHIKLQMIVRSILGFFTAKPAQTKAMICLVKNWSYTDLLKQLWYATLRSAQGDVVVDEEDEFRLSLRNPM